MNNQKMDERTKVIVDDAVEAAKGFIMLQTSEKEFILGFIKGMAAQKELSEAREKIAQGGESMRDTAIKILVFIIVMVIFIILTIAFYSFINSLNIPDWMKYALII